MQSADGIEKLRYLNSKFDNLALVDPEEHSKFAEATHIGLKHNLMLKDFLPLADIYEKLNYFYETESYKVDKHRKILISRLIFKLQCFLI